MFLDLSCDEDGLGLHVLTCSRTGRFLSVRRKRNEKNSAKERGPPSRGTDLPVPSCMLFRPPAASCRTYHHWALLSRIPVFRPSNVGSFSAVWTAPIARIDAFCSIFQNLQDYQAEFFEIWKILQILRHLQTFCWIFTKIADFSNRFFAKILRLQRCKRMQIL